MLIDGSQQPTTSDPGMMGLGEEDENEGLVNMLWGKIEPMLINSFHQNLLPVNAVKEGNFRTWLPEETRNDPVEERSLHLKFLDKVSGHVLTGKEIKGTKDGPLEVALFDATGNVVTSGPESCAEVEILLIDDKEYNMTSEIVENGFIKTGAQRKPHFAKNVYVNLDKGVAKLTNLKLGQDSVWTPITTCRLGARFVKNYRGLKVHDALTEPFKVKDNRNESRSKCSRILHLDSEVWRLRGIGRRGKPCKRLEEKNIKTVQDFLLWRSVNPKGLKEMLGDKNWEIIEGDALTCQNDDNKMYCYKPSTKPQMGIIYDSVGELKGVIDKSHFVPIDDLSADKKDHAHKLLSHVLESSAFVDRYKTFFNDEASLLQQYPYKSSGLKASTSCSIQQFLNANGSECININQTAEPGYSSQSICSGNNLNSLGPLDMVVEQPNHIPTYSVIPCQLPSREVSAPDQDYANPYNNTSHSTQHIHSIQMNGHENVDDESGGLPTYGWVRSPDRKHTYFAHACNMWTWLTCVLKWRFKRGSLNATHPKRKKLRAH